MGSNVRGGVESDSGRFPSILLSEMRSPVRDNFSCDSFRQEVLSGKVVRASERIEEPLGGEEIEEEMIASVGVVERLCNEDDGEFKEEQQQDLLGE